MIFDNCLKYINVELAEQLPQKMLQDKNIVIWGLDSMSKTVIHYLKSNGCNNISIYDRHVIVEDYAGIKIEKGLENIEQHQTELVLVVSNKTYLEELKKFNVSTLWNVVDLTYIRMDKMPNPIALGDKIVEVTMSECQQEMLSMMKDIHRVCVEHNIRYFLDSGTLLGAIRHQGFIPWDDDMDIAMPLVDLIKFCRIYAQEGKYEIDSCYTNEENNLPLSVLTKVKSSTILTEFRHFPLRAITGIAIDILPLIGYPDTLEEQMDFMRIQEQWGDLWKEKVIIPYGTEQYSSRQHREVLDGMEQIMKTYDFDSSENIGTCYFGPFMKNRAMPGTEYRERIPAKFEDAEFYIPNGYEAPLKKWYQDYMQFPPEEQRVPHNTEGIFRLK